MKKNYKPVFNLICAALMLVLLVFQFLPGYWTAQKTRPEKDGTYKTDVASLQGYMWMPSEYTVLGDYFDDLYGDELVMNDAVMMPIVTLVCGVLHLVLCAFMRHKSWLAILPTMTGAAGVIGYLCFPIYQLNSLWILHFVLATAILLVGATSLVTSVALWIKAFKQELKDIAAKA